jgi:hypothetical protein
MTPKRAMILATCTAAFTVLGTGALVASLWWTTWYQWPMRRGSAGIGISSGGLRVGWGNWPTSYVGTGFHCVRLETEWKDWRWLPLLETKPVATAQRWCLAALPLWIPLAVSTACTILFMRAARRRARGHCPACGYDLAGLPACPECGHGCRS